MYIYLNFYVNIYSIIFIRYLKSNKNYKTWFDLLLGIRNIKSSNNIYLLLFIWILFFINNMDNWDLFIFIYLLIYLLIYNSYY